MLPQRLRGPGRAIFRAVSPRASLGGEAGGSGGSVWESVSLPNLRRKASNTWSAVQDTFLSTKVCYVLVTDHLKPSLPKLYSFLPSTR